MQPTCERDPHAKGRWRHYTEHEGHAALHFADGWTALCLWDRSGDRRGGCNSNFFAFGRFTFAEMCERAKKSFPEVWSRFTFQVVLVGPDVASAENCPLFERPAIWVVADPTGERRCCGEHIGRIAPRTGPSEIRPLMIVEPEKLPPPKG